MADGNHYLTRIEPADMPASPGNFTGQVTAKYLDHPGGELAPSELDPAQFRQVPPEQARYLGVEITDDALPTPLFFGIRMAGDTAFMTSQADEIANGMLSQVAPFDKTAALVGLAATAKLHAYVPQMNDTYHQAQGSGHPHIDAGQETLMENLSQAFARTAMELQHNGVNAARATWQRELSAIRSGRSIATESNPVIANITPGLRAIEQKGRYTPDSDDPPASGQISR